MTALAATCLAVLVVAGGLLLALTHHHRQENPMPELPPPPSDVPLALTTDLVDQLLAQVERDRAVGYWQAPEHRDTLAGAETWLSSLRDWLAAGGQVKVMPKGPAWEPVARKPRAEWERAVLQHVLEHAPADRPDGDVTPDWLSAIATAMIETRDGAA
jgi:hypothetical protein